MIANDLKMNVLFASGTAVPLSPVVLPDEISGCGLFGSIGFKNEGFLKKRPTKRSYRTKHK
jgi:hypothetical protein